MNKVDHVLQEVRDWVRRKRPYDTATMCRLLSLYTSLTPEEKYELKKQAGDYWKYLAEIAGWGVKYGIQCNTSTSTTTTTAATSTTLSIKWILIGIIAVVALTIILFMFKR